jgi:two-component system, LytTR family, sensor kinase
MTPSARAFPSFARLQAAGWFGLYLLVLVALLPYLQHNPRLIWDNTVMVAAWCLASLPLRAVCRALRRRGHGWLPLALATAAWSIVFGVAGTTLGFIIISMLPATDLQDWSEFLKSAVQAAILMMFWCTLYFGILQWHDAAQDRERRLSAEAAARQARLDALRYQLNPHFLFNALNAVTTLVLEGNAAAATRMLTQIAGLLRSSLDEAPLEVSLDEELAFTERYLAIEQIRLEERLQVEWLIQTETRPALVPSLLLQPLVENAVRHGIAPHVSGGRLAIRSQLCGERLQIRVSNSGAQRTGGVRPSRRPPGGIGLANTAERLRTLYGSDHRLVLSWPEAGGCEVLMDLPFRTAAILEGLALCAH